jgi:hypothetical protein
MGTRDEGSAKTTIEPSSFGRGTQTFIGSVILLAAFLFVWMGSESQFLQAPGEIKLRSGTSSSTTHFVCESKCGIPKNDGKKNRYYGTPADLLDTKKLLQRVESAKNNLIEDLRKDYGPKYFNDMFLDPESGEFRPVVPITPDGPSMQRLKRKLLLKVLSVQSNIKKQERCECWNGNEPLPSDTGNGNEPAPASLFFEKYVWATGGHSAAAGHGNLFNESYTAYIERDLVDIFGAAGIQFVGRNYAMGGTSSGSEITMCWEQIFGSDVDFFSWDYGMTDGNNAEKILLYGLRGGLSPGRPAFMGIHTGGRARPYREARIKDLEDMGMAGFNADESLMSKMRDAVPESAGLSEKDLAALPELVRNLKCNGGWEKGEPYCDKEKYTHFICENRKKQVSWHPGYKDNAITGHGIALFLANALISALKTLLEELGDDREAILEQLYEQEQEAYENLTKAPLPEVYTNLFKKEEKGMPSDFNQALFFKEPSICHTGRLPSQTRYLGYLTESNDVGGPAPWSSVTYDQGIRKQQAIMADTEGLMSLVWDEKHREMDCPVTCMPDDKDTFMTHNKYGWTKLTFPNAAERKAYHYDPKKFKGIVIVILRPCDWGKCEQGFLTLQDFAENKWEMKINGKKVESIVGFGADATVAKGSDGIYFSPNSDGTYDIEIKVNEKGSFVLVSSFILY